MLLSTVPEPHEIKHRVIAMFLMGERLLLQLKVNFGPSEIARYIPVEQFPHRDICTTPFATSCRVPQRVFVHIIGIVRTARTFGA